MALRTRPTTRASSVASFARASASRAVRSASVQSVVSIAASTGSRKRKSEDDTAAAKTTGKTTKRAKVTHARAQTPAQTSDVENEDPGAKTVVSSGAQGKRKAVHVAEGETGIRSSPPIVASDMVMSDAELPAAASDDTTHPESSGSNSRKGSHSSKVSSTKVGTTAHVTSTPKKPAKVTKVTKSKATKSYAHNAPSSLSNVDTTNRDAWGSRRFHREDQMIAASYAAQAAADLIFTEQAARYGAPWAQKGSRVAPYDAEYLAQLDPKGKKKDKGTYIMPIEQARRIQARKDREMEKWLEDWRAGKIDDNGNTIEPAGGSEKGVGSEDGEGEKEGVEVKKKKTEKGKGGVEKKGEGKTEILPTIVEVSSPAKAPSSTSTTSSTSTSSSKASKKRRGPSPTDPSVYVPEIGMPDYRGLDYLRIASLCRARGLKSGGSHADCLARLMADDVAVRDGTERTDLVKGGKGSQKTGREYKTEVPVVPVYRGEWGEGKGLGEKRKGDGEEDGV